MSCKVVGKRCLKSGEKVPLLIDLTDFCERRWDNKSHAGIYSTGDFVRPTPLRRTGYDYEATTGGQTGVVEPSWPTTIGATVADGSVVWTCRAISNNSLLKTISGSPAPAWDGDGLTISGETVTSTSGRQSVFAFAAAALASPGKYEPKVTVTFSDTHAEVFGVEVKLEG